MSGFGAGQLWQFQTDGKTVTGVKLPAGTVVRTRMRMAGPHWLCAVSAVDDMVISEEMLEKRAVQRV